MKLAHVTIMTNCIDQSVEFYEKIVGLTIQRDMRDQPEHAVVFLADAAGDTCIELGANPNPYQGEGLFLGFAVEDAEAQQTKMRELGLEPGEMVFPNPHAKFFLIQDPNGVTVQFVQED